jgi:hypothetical protein
MLPTATLSRRFTCLISQTELTVHAVWTVQHVILVLGCLDGKFNRNSVACGKTASITVGELQSNESCIVLVQTCCIVSGELVKVYVNSRSQALAAPSTVSILQERQLS